MGREIRRVPPNWKHPKREVYDYKLRTTVTRYQPMFDKPFVEQMRKWINGWEAWERGERPDYCTGESRNLQYWEWDGCPPDPAFHRPDWKPEEMTWYQVFETVSEGTPVTPPFETQQELVDYLVENGDFWDQWRRKEMDSIMECGPWKREAAEKFVFGDGWAPSIVISNGKVMSGVNALVDSGK